MLGVGDRIQGTLRAMRAGLLVTVLVACSGGAGQAPDPVVDPNPVQPPARAKDYKAEVDELATELIDGEWMVGVAVGLIHDGSVHYYGYGRVSADATRSADAKRAPDADTLFEIGSVTKVFTSLLLADAVGRLAVDFEDPASKYAPEGKRIPAHGDGEITLQHLATHTSGLPRMPSNFRPKDPANPFADYSVDDLYTFLSGHVLARAPGAKYEYSNLGAGLLGDLLSRAEGTTYEQLVLDRICGPLGMKRTFISVPEAEDNRAGGHDGEGKPVGAWDIPTLAGAGAFRSSVRDMVAFVRANLALEHRELGPAMKLTHEPRHTIEQPAGEIALGWHVAPDGVRWHNGQTGGYHSYVAFDPDTQIGVVVLSNTATSMGDAFGQALVLMLRGKPYALELPTTVKLSEETVAKYVGTYKMSADFVISISRDDDRLFAQATGWPGFRLYARSETEFYLRVVEAKFTFQVRDDGRVTGLVLQQGGQEFRGSRL